MEIIHHNIDDLISIADDVKKYDKPIYIKGKLGLWNYDIWRC